MVIAVLPVAGPELGLTDATAGGAGGTSVTTALLRAVGAAWLVAATARFIATGTTAGAVYRPLVEITPTFELPPVTPFTLQVTAVFDVPVTDAVNCCEPPGASTATTGAIQTLVAFANGGGNGPGPNAGIEKNGPKSSPSVMAATGWSEKTRRAIRRQVYRLLLQQVAALVKKLHVQRVK
jgi:hypothetical protein